MKWESHISFKILSFLLIGILIGCSKDDGNACLVSRGNQSVVTESITSFHTLLIEGRCNVVLVQDSQSFVEVNYGENLINAISTIVESETLSITENTRCDFLRKTNPLPEITVHFDKLETVLFRNAGRLTNIDTLRLDSLEIDVRDAPGSISLLINTRRVNVANHTGATDIILRGNTVSIGVYSASFAPILASELIANNANVVNNGVSDLHINAKDALFYQIFDQGNIFLSGTTNAVEWNKSGSGNVFFE